MANELLALAYDSVDTSKAARLRDCSKTLTFRVYADGSKKLESMNSCRVRLCPICTWRRSLKIFYNTKKIIDYMLHEGDYAFIFMTLTLKNCKPSDLAASLDEILSGYNRFMQLKELKAISKGWYRGLEITHDTDEYITVERYQKAKKYYNRLGLKPLDPNPNFNTYHPHLHIIIAVNKSYFSDSRIYLKQSRLVELWQQCCRLDYSPTCDLRKVKGDNYSKAVCEISKYAAKSKDYIIPDDWDLTVETVALLDRALAGRRLIAYGGKMRDINKLLKLDDIEDGSLVDVGENQQPEGDYFLQSYFWYSGYNQYLRID